MRKSGVLLPVFSLPGPYGIGCFSKEAYKFVDFLADAGQSFWQMLPIGPTSYGDSPYQSFSTFAGNPYFIDLNELIDQGLLKKAECDHTKLKDTDSYINYGLLYEKRYPLLKKAYGRLGADQRARVEKFVKKNKKWLPDYALFMALKDAHGGASFMKWEDELRLRDSRALAQARSEYEDEIFFYEWLQYEFFRQWKKLKKYANKKGIEIIGDIPIYVAEDSADVWADPELFQMDEDCRPVAVAGCPPDAFSADGQLWGNPLYDWKYHASTGFDWWIRRMKNCMKLYDVIRIDHFRGFDEYYSIPAGAKNAKNGKWEKGPGKKLFKAINKSIGDAPIIAEDLGFMTDSVRKLVRDTGFPNMKVLEFAFDGRDAATACGKTNEYLPFNYDKNCVVYTGTHDNETLRGWLGSIKKAEYNEVQEYVDYSVSRKDVLTRKLVRAAQASSANMCIIPMQDWLGLGNEARINTPSTIGENWKWRMDRSAMSDGLAKEILEITRLYGR
ncbi:MAG: 4-alpha-glucanotransferase [Lachnospiraceae bacterium]|nr:4-alpha-glucanotransferase [Lachnospiraceae bacterium]